ncbi:hypothetical protein NKG94_30460 [Micromonospora sp. M12]
MRTLPSGSARLVTRLSALTVYVLRGTEVTGCDWLVLASATSVWVAAGYAHRVVAPTVGFCGWKARVNEVTRCAES